MRKLNCIWAIVFLLGIFTLSGCNNSNLGLSPVSSLETHNNTHSDKVTNIQSFNEDPPKFVYRVDRRPPNKIFENGFQLRGDGSNDNLAEHILQFRGYTDSAFISTTSSRNCAEERLSIIRRSTTVENYVYVYTIRATNNFYSAVNTFDALPDALAMRRTNRALASIIDSEYEWSSHGAIPANTVETVEIIRWDPTTQRFSSIGHYSNPSYVDADTRGNPAPWHNFDIGDDQYDMISVDEMPSSTDMCMYTHLAKGNKTPPYGSCDNPIVNTLKPIGPYQIACVSTGFLFMAKVTCSILTNESHHVGNFGAIAGGLAFLGSESSHNAYFKIPVSGLAGAKVGGVNMILGAFGPLVELQLGPSSSDPTGYTVTSLQGVQIAGLLGSVTGYFY